MQLNKFGALVFTLVTVAVHGVAQAGPISFNESTCKAGSVNLNGGSCTTTVAGVDHTAKVSAWSAPSAGNFGAATIGFYPSSGLGIIAPGESASSSEHAVDNARGTDAFLINFGSSSFALNQISLGWKGGDADVSILRYTGTAMPLLGGQSVGSLKNAQGWEWIGDYSVLNTNSPLTFNDSGNVKTASWWMVSAYNAMYSGSPASGSLNGGNDYFKLSGLSGAIVAATPPSSEVPEPGTLALFGVALIGFAAARRKWQAR